MTSARRVGPSRRAGGVDQPRHHLHGERATRARGLVGATDGAAVADELRLRVDTIRSASLGASALTTAELRLLPLLPTHLSFREIGERLHVSATRSRPNRSPSTASSGSPRGARRSTACSSWVCSTARDSGTVRRIEAGPPPSPSTISPRLDGQRPSTHITTPGPGIRSSSERASTTAPRLLGAMAGCGDGDRARCVGGDRRHAVGPTGRPGRRSARRRLGEDGSRQPDGLVQGPHGAGHDQRCRAGRQVAARTDGRRVHRREHGQLAGLRLRGDGASVADRDVRCVRRREAPHDGGVRCDGRDRVRVRRGSPRT